MSDILDTAAAGPAVVRGGALRVAGFVTGVVVSLLGVALVTRHLGTGIFDRYQTVIALVTIVAMVTDLGMSALAMREWSQRSGSDREHFLRVLLGLRLAMTVAGVAIASALAVILGYDAEMVAATAVAGVGVMAGVLGATLTVPLSAELRMVAVTFLDVGRQVATTGLLVLLVLGGTRDIVPYVAIVIPANMIVVVGAFWLMRGRVSVRPIVDARAWLGLVKPSLVFALAAAVGSLYIYAAMVLTQLVTSEYQTGLFAASFRVWSVIAAVPAVLASTAFPVLARAARDDQVRLGYATQRLFEGNSILGGAALIGCVLAAEPIIAVVGGAEFADADRVLRIHGIALALTFVVVTWGFALMALHRHRALVVVNASAFVVSVVTVLLLARSYGAYGAAWGTLLGELTLSTGYGIALLIADPTMRPVFGRVARLVPIVLASLAAGHWSGLPPLLATGLGLAVYFLLALVCRAVPDEIVEHMPRPMRSVAGRP